jgi:hypothetical protein
MWRPVLMNFALTLMLGCASINPISVSGGVCGSYYLTNSHTGYLRTADGQLGIFAVGHTSLTDTARLDLRIFNISGENTEIQIQEVSLFRDSIPLPSERLHLSMAPGQMRKFELEKSPITIYAPRWPISLHLMSGVESLSLDLILRRRRASSYIEAISIDGKAPESVGEFQRLPTNPPEAEGPPQCGY